MASLGSASGASLAGCGGDGDEATATDSASPTTVGDTTSEPPATDQSPSPTPTNTVMQNAPPDVTEALAAGKVVPIGPGIDASDAVGNEDSDTPVQDAIDMLDRTDTVEDGDEEEERIVREGAIGGGVVILPPGVIRNHGPIRRLRAKRLIGCGIGAQFGWRKGHEQGEEDPGAGEMGTVLLIPKETGAPGILMQDDYVDSKYTYMTEFTLSGAAERNGHQGRDNAPAIEWRTNTASRRQDIGRLRIENFRDERDDGGIIRMGEGAPWSSSWWAVAINDCAGHQINITPQGRNLCFNIYNLLCTPPKKNHGAIDNGNHSVVLRSRGKVPKMRIDTLNIGGAAHKAVDVKLTANGYLDMGLVNFEPKGMGNTLKDEVVRVAGPGSFHLDHLIYHDPFRRLFNFDGNTAANIIRSHHAAGDGRYENGVIEVTGNPAGASWYFGPPEDVVNNSNREGFVRCLSDAGTGV